MSPSCAGRSKQDPSFEVSTLVQASRGLAVRAGSPPAALTADALNAFDVVLIGAPEELRAAGDRGASSVRAAEGRDSRASSRPPAVGSLSELIPSPQFDEVLVENRSSCDRSRAPRCARRSSSFTERACLAVRCSRSWLRERSNRKRANALWCSSGQTALAASYSRARWTRGAFARRLTMGSGGSGGHGSLKGALAAPARLEVDVSPGVPRPAEDVTIRARIRRTEFEDAADRTEIPAVRARLVGADGAEDTIRLWPTAEQGVLEGHLEAPPAGCYDLQVSTATGASVDEVVVVAADARHPSGFVEGRETALPWSRRQPEAWRSRPPTSRRSSITCAGCRAGKSIGRSARPGRSPW